MKDIRLMEKDEINGMRKYRHVPAGSLALIIVGLVLLVLGFIYYRNTDMTKYYKTKDYSQEFAGDGISKVELDTQWCDVTISPSSDGKVHVDAANVPEEFDAFIKDGKLKVMTDKRPVKLSQYGITGLNDSKVDILLPAYEYELLSISSGAGDVKINSTAALTLDIDTGAGDVELNSCTFGEKVDIDAGTGNVDFNSTTAGKVDIDAGAGEVECVDCTFKGFNIDSGAGDIDFDGTVNGNIDIDCAMGSCTIKLTNPESDFSGNKYKLKVETAVGEKNITYNN